MKIVVYEDKFEQLFPLINFYPQFNIRVGMKTIAEHIAFYFPKFRFEYIGRDIFNFPSTTKNEPTMYLSARLLLKERIHLPYEETKFLVSGEEIGFVKTNAPFPRNLNEVKTALHSIKKKKEISGIVLDYPWDIIKYNNELITEHFKHCKKPSHFAKHVEYKGSKKSICISRDATIHKFIYIDCEPGPVFVDKRAEIKPFTTIIGPSYIGEGAIIDRAKVVRSTIGPYCRIGGEVEECIFQGFSNKCHEGFVGHSFIGEWVNIGSLTTNSDLKNNYSSVRVKIGDKEYDTKMTKIGCFIGDHTKLGIGTLIPTGAVIGSFVNFFGGGMMPRYVPGFKWLGPGADQVYDIEKAIQTTKLVMGRRGIKMSSEYEHLIRLNYKNR